MLAGGLPGVRTFSNGFLLKFLRARDFDVELALKVPGKTNQRERETIRIMICQTSVKITKENHTNAISSTNDN